MPAEWQPIFDWADQHADLLGFLLALLIALISLVAYFRNWLSRLWRKPDPKPDLAAERRILLSNVQERITQWRQDTFAQKANITLRYSPDPGRVEPYWRSQAPEKDFPDGADIAQLFEEAGRRLLIVGDPGTGKSNELHSLAAYLHEQASQSEEAPVPVILNLASWAIERHQNLSDWIAKELEHSYRFNVGRAQDWKDLVLPLLDGLDEVREDVRDECLAVINAYAWQGPGNSGHKLALTSRPEEYDALQASAPMPAARIERLTLAEIEARVASMPSLRGVLQRDDASPEPAKMRDLLDTPLMLALLHEGAEADAVREPDARDRIYARFLEAALPKLKGYELAGAKRWLGWLAASLESRNVVRFDLEDLDFSDLSNQAHRTAKRRFGLTVAVVVAAPAMLGASFIIGVFAAACFGLQAWLFRFRDDLLRPTDYLRFEHRPLSVWTPRLLGKLLASGLPVGLAVFFVWGRTLALQVAALYALTSGLLNVLFVWLDEDLEKAAVVERPSPGDGVRGSVKHALWFVAVGLIVGLGLRLLAITTRTAFDDEEHFGAVARAVFGIAPSLVAYSGALLGLFKGGFFVLRHYIVRSLLRRDNLIPRRYVAFLEQCTRLGVLKRVGGGYQFRHRELRRYIARRHAPVTPP